MNKKILKSLPFLACMLTACNFSITTANESHEPGLYAGDSKIDTTSVLREYFTGDTLTGKDLLTEMVIEPKKEDATNVFKEAVEIAEYLNAPTVVTQINEFKEVAKNANGIRIGDMTAKLDGRLSFTCSQSIKMVSIKAAPYVTMVTGFEETSYQSDQNVAISLNSSKYIKLNVNVNESGVAETTDCNYILPESTNKLTIDVALQRAIISKITLYY